jgi:hypothetical protein
MLPPERRAQTLGVTYMQPSLLPREIGSASIRYIHRDECKQISSIGA